MNEIDKGRLGFLVSILEIQTGNTVALCLLAYRHCLYSDISFSSYSQHALVVRPRGLVLVILVTSGMLYHTYLHKFILFTLIVLSIYCKGRFTK